MRPSHTKKPPMPRGRVDAILMASGFSRRFGAQNKLLQPFCGRPLADWALQLANNTTALNRIFFVYADSPLLALAQQYPAITPLHNANPGRGPCESVRLGILASDAEYYIFIPCDQPLLDNATLAVLLRRRRPGAITVPCYGGTQGSPAIFSADFRSQLLALEDGQSPRIIKQCHPDAVVPVALPGPLPLADVDTPQQLRQLELLASEQA